MQARKIYSTVAWIATVLRFYRQAIIEIALSQINYYRYALSNSILNVSTKISDIQSLQTLRMYDRFSLIRSMFQSQSIGERVAVSAMENTQNKYSHGIRSNIKMSLFSNNLLPENKEREREM